MVDGIIHVAIGFATGRIGFQNVLRAYIYHLQETNFLYDHNMLISLFVAYDPSYSNTTRADYDNLTEEERQTFHICRFIGPEDIQAEKDRLAKDTGLSSKEVGQAFGTGYAVQRNIILFEALREKVDGLIFLDDDEYPLAVTESGGATLWSGQHVMEEHIKYLQFSDITYGYHCGYLTPVPAIEFDGILPENIFHQFTDALSSDVLKWEDVSRLIRCGGVTYADKNVLSTHQAELVPEVNGAKFISGSNIGINLTNPERVLPFYNPPGARGEDSILSTCLSNYNVKRIPVYTFHDGFSFYGSLLKGVLPLSLEKISLYDSVEVNNRFYKACIGWARYKPLYTYLTQPENFSEIMKNSLTGLEQSLPYVCSYFNNSDFHNLYTDMHHYAEKVPEHNRQFHKMQQTWSEIISFICQ
ncbi:hypothetical protein [Caproicibacterium sp. XB2]|uniref:hypothetical protein n=1 Tax=Caproicibacterium sp. XB2 TaxID=3388458 RepID=UPI000A297572|nr:hypothetical protein B6259_07975 [Ruminococcaceae bacterium CPB6]